MKNLQEIQGFVARYKFTAAQSGEEITLTSKKGKVGTISASGEVNSISAGSQNLMGALAKREISEFLKGVTNVG